MSREEIHKLIGGYATGTLTSEEREALFAAALEDQELFDALAREQALRDLLADPAAKAQLLSTLADPPRPWYQKMIWLRPAAAALAMAGIATLAVITLREKQAPPLAVTAPVTPAPTSPTVAAPGHDLAEVRRAEPAQPMLKAKDSANRPGSPAFPPKQAALARKPALVLSESAPPAPPAAPAPAPMAPAAAPPAAPQRTVAVTGAVASLDAPPGPANSTLQNDSAQIAQQQMETIQQAASAARGGFGGGGAGGRVAQSDAIQLYNLASGQPAGIVGGVSTAMAAFRQVTDMRTLALRYSMMRKTEADQSRLEIQFIPAADGYLTVAQQGGAALVATPVLRLQPLSVPVPDGARQLSVTYSTPTQPPAQLARKDEKAGAAAPPPPPVQETIAGVTYVGARTPAGEIRFTIDVK